MCFFSVSLAGHNDDNVLAILVLPRVLTVTKHSFDKEHALTVVTFVFCQLSLMFS